MPVDPIAWLYSLEQFGIKLGLDNIRTLLAGVDHPERAFLSAHVAGTNGKGSVTAMAESILRAAGHRTGRYTSPHLIDLRERFVVNGEMVSERMLIQVVAELRTKVKELVEAGRLPATPTFFEVTTAAAFEIFRRHGVTVAVCEVGLGGRLDATNVLQPVASAITSIALDHERHLGHTVAAIAREKAGIIKAGVPVVIGHLPPEARAVIDEVAARHNAPLIDATAEVHVDRKDSDEWALPEFGLRTPMRNYGSVVLGLRGDHQVGNAAVAVRLVESMAERGVDVPPDAVVRGLRSAAWAGRLDRRTYPDGRDLLLDAAHNPEGAAALARFLRETRAAPRPLVFAATSDKNIAEVLRALLPVSSSLVITRSSNARSERPAAIAAIARTIAPELPIAIEPSPERAVDLAWRSSPSVVVAGSIFLLGDIMRHVEGS